MLISRAIGRTFSFGEDVPVPWIYAFSTDLLYVVHLDWEITYGRHMLLSNKRNAQGK
jgi:hypothetical protein